MGGTSSRELSRKDSKRKRKREQKQWSRQQEFLPTEHTPDLYNDSDIRNFGYGGHDTLRNMDNQTGFDQFQDNQWGVEYLSNFDMQRDFYSGDRNDFDQPNWNNNPNLGEDVVGRFGVSFENLNGFPQRPRSSNDRFEERQFRRPIRRHHSFNENRLQFQSGQSSMRDFSSSRIRCNSMVNLNDNYLLFEGQYMGNRFTNFSSFNLPMQYHPFDRSPQNTSTWNAQSSVGRGGIKRYSYGGYSNEVCWDDGSNSACEEILDFDSPVQPRVKRRQSDESPSVSNCLSSGDDRNRSDERSHSGLSFYSNTTSNSDTARSQSDEVIGALDILSFPSEWSSYAVDKTGYVNVSLSSSEGKSVQKFFQRTCKSKDSYLSISGIVRIENPFLHSLYLLKKEEMAVRNRHVDELFLYHGTKKRLVRNICENNLDWRCYSEMHRFGKGVSFSPSATYSSHYSDDRRCDRVVLLFKVLVSNCLLGLPDMDIPLDVEGVSYYDTSIKEDTSVIVKYNDNEFYPLYKILYNKV